MPRWSTCYAWTARRARAPDEHDPTSVPEWRNGIRWGLKILCRESGVWVRLPPPAPPGMPYDLESGTDSKRGGDMRTRTILMAVAVSLAGFGLAIAADPQIGTWKLNEGKSKLAPGATKNSTVGYTAVGDSVKVTVDGVDKDGKPVHHEWTGKYDGKEYPVTGDPTSDSRSYKKVDEHTMELTAMKAGKVTLTGRIVIAADGKSRTVSTTATDPSGKKISSTGVYDKQ